jgi:hypothetical protein
MITKKIQIDKYIVEITIKEVPAKNNGKSTIAIAKIIAGK